VEGLTKHAVESYIAIEKKMDEGNQHRTVAATLMNAKYHNLLFIIIIVQAEHILSSRLSLSRLRLWMVRRQRSSQSLI